MASQTKTIILTIGGIAFIAPCLFFAFYTVRLIYLNLTMADAAAHRTGGMLIGAIVFPLAAIVFGIAGVLCFRAARRGIKKSYE